MGSDNDTLHAVTFWILLSVYLPLNLTVWWLTGTLFKELMCGRQSVNWKETLSVDNLCAKRKSHTQLDNEHRMLVLVGAIMALLHHCCHSFTFIKGANSMQVVWWHGLPLVFLEGIILLIALGFFCLLLGSIIRLRSIFTDTVYEMSSTRYLTYLSLICSHAMLELGTLFVPPSEIRWSLWVSYDLILCVLCIAICWEFCSRLVLLIEAMHQSGEDMMHIPTVPSAGQTSSAIPPPTVAQPNTKHPTESAPLELAVVHGRGNSLKNLSRRFSFRSASRLRSEHTAEQLQLLQSATKMIVLTVMVCVSVCFWSIGPVALIWRKNLNQNNNNNNDDNNHITYQWMLLLLEMTANIIVNPCMVLYYYLSFHFSNSVYWWLCQYTCHSMVGFCVLPIEDSNDMDEQIRSTLTHQPI